jgi:hypothetical protein
MVLGVVVAVAAAVLAPSAVAVVPAIPADIGLQAYGYVGDLTALYPKRAAGTLEEAAAAGLVASWFEDAGYVTELQEFTFTREGVAYPSQNVLAFRPADVKRGKGPVPLVVVGAHYDAVLAGEGADDNASGVGALLEVAARVKSARLPYDIAFVSFGAEEAGLIGSKYYVAHMGVANRTRCIAMINFDSLIVGDYAYIHAGTNGETWARDEMLGIIDELDLPIKIQPGLNHKYPAGITPNTFSDYTAFNQVGIPIAAFESTNWEILGDDEGSEWNVGDYDGYTQTEEYGSFWHTPNDTLAIIEQCFPGRPLQWLAAYTTLVTEFLVRLTP